MPSIFNLPEELLCKIYLHLAPSELIKIYDILPFPQSLIEYAHCKNWIDVVQLKKPFLLPFYNMATNNSTLQEGVFKIAVENQDIEAIKWLSKNARNNESSAAEELALWSSQINNFDNMIWLKPGRKWWEECKELDPKELARWKVETKCPWNVQTFTTAAYYGQLNVMKWLFQNGCEFDSSAFQYAADNANPEVIEWLKENNFPVDSEALENAILSGNLKLTKELIDYGVELNRYCLSNAIRTENREMIDFLVENNCPIDNYNLSRDAFRTRDLDFIKYLYSRGVPLDAEIQFRYTGHVTIEILEWIYSISPQLNAKIFAEFIRYGSVENLEWLQSKNCPIDEKLFETNQLETIKWLNDKQITVTDTIMCSAARDGNIDALKFMIENNFPACDSVYCSAMFAGSVSILDLLFQYKIPLSLKVFVAAMSCSWMEGAIWLIDRNCPFDDSVYVALLESYYRNDTFSILKYLYDKKKGLTESVFCVALARYNNLESDFTILEWLNEVNCPRDESASLEAAGNNPVLLNWLNALQ